jgi:heat shock protein HslJ
MPEVPMIRFVADSSRVMGYGGCNQFTGPFHQSSDSVRIGPLASTKRMCLGIDIESRIFAAFDRTTTVERTGDVLRLRAGDTVLMECRPAASPRTNP